LTTKGSMDARGEHPPNTVCNTGNGMIGIAIRATQYPWEGVHDDVV
jgi:hypothetical protein